MENIGSMVRKSQQHVGSGPPGKLFTLAEEKDVTYKKKSIAEKVCRLNATHKMS
jgi:hypothetical protein